MVARKLSSYDVATSPESFSKRPSVYIDPDSDIFEGLQYLHNIKRQNCINCLQLWKKSSAALEGIFRGVSLSTSFHSSETNWKMKLIQTSQIFIFLRISQINLHRFSPESSNQFTSFDFFGIRGFSLQKTCWTIEIFKSGISRILGVFFLSITAEAFMTTFTLFSIVNFSKLALP